MPHLLQARKSSFLHKFWIAGTKAEQVFANSRCSWRCASVNNGFHMPNHIMLQFVPFAFDFNSYLFIKCMQSKATTLYILKDFSFFIY